MKSVFLLLTIVLGALVPEAQVYGYLIQYLIMGMLFFAFLDLPLKRELFVPQVFWVLVANVLLAFLWYFAVLPFDATLALIAFVTAITPTATAAPAVIHFLRGNVGVVTAAVIATNIVVALLLPLALAVLGVGSGGSLTEPLGRVFMVIGVPLALSLVLKSLTSRITAAVTKLRPLSFYLWLVVVFLAVSQSSHFIQNHPEIPLADLGIVAGLALVICVTNFVLGWFLGGTKYALETSQGLGQKNTMFTAWYALTFLNPLIALGPVFYLIFHNLYNSYQIFKTGRG